LLSHERLPDRAGRCEERADDERADVESVRRLEPS
jgi:hypothetical protein